MKSIVLAGACVAILLAGCAENPLGNRCTPIQSSIAQVDGDTVTTTSGLVYIEEELGSGAPLASCQYASIHVRGSLQNGTTFFNTRAAGGVWRVSPGRDDVMVGLAEGMVGMRAGGIRTLIVPPHLGFGSQGDPEFGVPPNSTTIWIVEMIVVSER